LGAELDLVVARSQVRRDEEKAGVEHLTFLFFCDGIGEWVCGGWGVWIGGCWVFGLCTLSVTPMPPLLPSCLCAHNI
jgi:hypothetical protein